MVRGTRASDKIPLITQGDNESLQNPNTEVVKSSGVSVVWKNLCVTAVIQKQHTLKSTTQSYKEIIHNVNGCIKPSSLVAIMGASGSGKSTLMSVLANRQPGDLRVNGDIRVNGRKIQMKYMRRISGYVYQDDLFVPTLTVLEHMHFAAKLKLDRRTSESDRAQIISELLTDVGLLKCSHSLIGSTSFGRGKVNLSGGEQKRLSVATELLTDPPLLFCDEPTTGLDSFSALKLTTVMKNLTEQRNKTIICSIHQPSDQLFGLFHQVILLYNGQIAFNGTPNDALEFFKSLGYNYTKDQNPAEFLVKSLAIVPGNETETAELASDICKQFENSRYAEDVYKYIENESHQEPYNFAARSKVQRVSWFYMFYLMVYRNALAILRDPSLQGMSILYKVGLGLLLGVCLMGTATMTQEGIQSLKGALFTMVAENFFSPTYAAMERIPKQLPVFQREYSNNMNTPLIFYLADLIAITPGLMLDTTVFTTFLYWLVELKPDFSTFAWTTFINGLVLVTSNAFGTMLSVLTNSFEVSQLVVLPLDTIYMVLSGIFISLRTVPLYFSWIRYVSWMTLSAELLLILQLQDVDSIACAADPERPCLKTGAEVLAQLDFSAANFAKNIILIILIYLVLHTLGICIFSIKMHFRTKSKSLKSKTR